MMFVSERDALLVSILVLASGLSPCGSPRSPSASERGPPPRTTRRELVAAVSHDLRTPIASLRLLVEAVDDEIVDEETRRRYLATMQTHIELAEHDDRRPLRALADRGRRHRLVDATGRARAAGRRDGRRDAPRGRASGVEIRTELGGRDACRRSADPERIQRVLFNLIRNAIRHTPADGSVTVRAEATGEGIEVEVADTGDGNRHSRTRDRVFEPFFRGGADAARDSDGAGLGLAISRAIVETHGGRIWLAPGESGTRVRFALPPAPRSA